MYTIKLTARSKRELKSISKRHQEAIGVVFEELKEDARIGKPLKRELTGRFSVRIGVYRIIYTVNETDKIIYVITAGHRSSVYN